jgi:hypothetical protein
VWMRRSASESRFTWLVSLCWCCAIVAGTPIAAAQNTAQPPDDPKEEGIFYLLSPSGGFVSLEFEKAQRQGTAAQVKGDHSPVRFPAGTPIRLVARLAPGTPINFFREVPDKGYRIVPLQTVNGKVFIKPGSGAAVIHFQSAKYGSSSILLTVDTALGPGEYCMGVATGYDAFCFGLDEAGNSPSTERSPPTAGGPGMTNADVVKMASAGLPDEVIIDSINRAPSRNFDLSVDGLIALKTAGVHDAAIAAMSRAGDSGAKTVASDRNLPPPAANVPDAQIEQPPTTNVFYLVGQGGRLRKLEPIRASITKTQRDLIEGNQVFYKLYGAHSPVRVNSANVALVVKLVPKDNKFHVLGDYDAHDLSGLYYRRFESVDGARQTMVSARPPRRGRTHDPDPGEFSFSTVKLGADFYKVIPNEPLIPGEYCVSEGLFSELLPNFCFGVDGPR